VNLVVIGASYGGLYALMDLLGALPTDFPSPVVVVQHRAPDDSDDTRLAQVLGRYSALPVHDAHDKEGLEPGQVYLAPPDYHLLVEDDHLVLAVDEPVNYSRPSIDVLFESAAAAFGDRVTAILLTGYGRDGAAGIARVREAGGRTIVQEPKTALQPAMPEAGIAAGAAEVVPLDEIAAKLAA
jgi:two-component system, chemotaxis family, protein-glutamate methylesterase/glutaminase